LTNAFDSVVGPLLERMRVHLRESKALATTRKALLPKLLSGELRLTDNSELL
jgi:hypothetical protein